MSNPLDHANISADTHSDETNSRRDFLLAGAGLVGAAAAAPLFSAPAQAQVNDSDLTTVLSRPRILIKDGVVLSLDRAVGDFARGDVLIEDGTIRDVGQGITAADAAVINAANHIVIPGFIDTHHHFYQGILRNILPNGLLNPDYQRDISNTLTAAYLPDDVYAGSLITALGMIDPGTTTAAATSQAQPTRAHTDASIPPRQESGLRV